MSITQAKVAIITVTYNSANFIQQYLTSITSFLKHEQHKLIIVDNASSDQTCLMVNEFAQSNDLSKNIHIISLKKNLGFGKGCNKGAEVAQEYQATHLWFLNPDTQIFNDSGQELISLLSKNSVDFAGSVLLNNKSIPRPGSFRFPKITNILLSNLKLGFLDRKFKNHTTAVPIKETAYEADWLTGASFMCSIDRFCSLNGFDPHYFLYFEEVDLFYRAKKAGYTVWTSPQSKVFHISGASTGINNHQKTINRHPKYWFESRRYFYISNFGHCYFAIADAALVMSNILWRARAKLQKRHSETPPHFIRDIIAHSSLKYFFDKIKKHQ